MVPTDWKKLLFGWEKSPVRRVITVTERTRRDRRTTHITDYAAKQGQAGNQQMVQLALGSKLTIPENLSIPCALFVGNKDSLVSEESCQVLVEKMGLDQSKLAVVEGADHNTIMSADNVRSIFATLKAQTIRSE